MKLRLVKCCMCGRHLTLDQMRGGSYRRVIFERPDGREDLRIIACEKCLDSLLMLLFDRKEG